MLIKHSRKKAKFGQSKGSCKNTLPSDLDLLFEEYGNDAKFRSRFKRVQHHENNVNVWKLASYVYRHYTIVGTSEAWHKRSHTWHYVFDPKTIARSHTVAPRKLKYIENKNLDAKQWDWNSRNLTLTEPYSIESLDHPIHQYRRGSIQSTPIDKHNKLKDKVKNEKGKLEYFKYKRRKFDSYKNQEHNKSDSDQAYDDRLIIEILLNKDKVTHAATQRQSLRLTEPAADDDENDYEGTNTVEGVETTTFQDSETTTDFDYKSISEGLSNTVTRVQNGRRQGKKTHMATLLRTKNASRMELKKHFRADEVSYLARRISRVFPHYDYNFRRHEPTFDQTSAKYMFSLLFYSLLCYSALFIIFIVWLFVFKFRKLRPSRMSCKGAKYLLCVFLLIPATAWPIYANDMVYKVYLSKALKTREAITSYLNETLVQNKDFVEIGDMLQSITEEYYTNFTNDVIIPTESYYRMHYKCENRVVPRKNVSSCVKVIMYRSLFPKYEKQLLELLDYFNNNFIATLDMNYINETEVVLKRYFKIHNIIYFTTWLYWMIHLLFSISLLVLWLLHIQLYYLRAPLILALISSWTIASIYVPLMLGLADLCDGSLKEIPKLSPFMHRNLSKLWIFKICYDKHRYYWHNYERPEEEYDWWYYQTANEVKRITEKLYAIAKPVFNNNTYEAKIDQFKEELDNLVDRTNTTINAVRCKAPRNFFTYFISFLCGRCMEGSTILAFSSFVVGVMYGALVIIVYKHSRNIMYGGEEVHPGVPWGRTPRPDWHKVTLAKKRRKLREMNE